MSFMFKYKIYNETVYIKRIKCRETVSIFIIKKSESKAEIR